MFIPFAKPLIDRQDIKHLNDAAKSGWISKGKYVDGFENKLKLFFKPVNRLEQFNQFDRTNLRRQVQLP